jgi:hypothetical protein
MSRTQCCRHCRGIGAEPPLVTIDGDRQVREWYLCERGWMLLQLGFSDVRRRDDVYQYLAPLGEPPKDDEVYLYVVRGSVLFRKLAGLFR